MSRKHKLQQVGESYMQNEENQLCLAKGQEKTEHVNDSICLLLRESSFQPITKRVRNRPIRYD